MTTKVENNISELIDKFNTIPLVSLPDIISAWIDDDGPPELSSSSGLESKISIEESELFGDIFHHEDMLIVDDCCDIESLTHLEKLKIDVIRGSIKEDTNYGDLKLLGSSNLGFVTDDIRKVLWPKILRIKQSELMIRRDEELSNIDKLILVSVYEQILKDVARSGSHLPVDSTEEEMDKFYSELTKIICWVLHKHPSMKYDNTQDVEWGYAFDIHLNAIFPLLIILNVLLIGFYHTFFDSSSFSAQFIGNTIWLIAANYYVYITFLGYTSIEILNRTAVIFWALPVILIIYIVTLCARINISRAIIDFYMFRIHT